jgi:hypothetical protein
MASSNAHLQINWKARAQMPNMGGFSAAAQCNATPHAFTLQHIYVRVDVISSPESGQTSCTTLIRVMILWRQRKTLGGEDIALLQAQEDSWAERLPLVSLPNSRGNSNRAALELHKV